MNVIILAAGMGSRLESITKLKPKSMIKVNGIPIIEYQILAYLKAGIPQENIMIAIGYKADQIKKYINKKYPKIKFVVNEKYLTTNNMFSFFLCLNELNDSSDLIISNGDCIYEENIIKTIVSSDLQNCIACEKCFYTEENMKIAVKGNKIVHISKEIKKEESYGVSIDLYKLSKKVIPCLKEIIRNIISKNANLWFEVAIDKLFNIFEFIPIDINGSKWIEIDDLNDLAMADIIFSNFTLFDKKCIVFDLDGTVYLGNRPIEATINFINKYSNCYDIYFMTNNTSKTPEEYVEKLRKFNIKTTINHILSPVIPLIEYLKNNNIRYVYVIGTKNFQDYIQQQFNDINFTEDRDLCQAVLVGYDTELTYEKLKTACLLLQRKEITLIATHQDMVCPTELGMIPDIGSFLKVLELTVNRNPHITFGKPNPILLKPLLNKYRPNEIVIIGDRLYTDKALADNAGIDFILVLTGETKRVDVENLEQFPKLIVKDLSYLENIVRS